MPVEVIILKGVLVSLVICISSALALGVVSMIHPGRPVSNLIHVMTTVCIIGFAAMMFYLLISSS